LSAIFLLSITALVLAGIRRFPFLAVGWFWYLGTLLPMIGIVQIGEQRMADRYTYFPLIGIFLALTWLVAEVVPAGILRARALPAAAVAVVALFAAVTYHQVGLWSDNVVFLRHAKDSTPDHMLAHEFLGSALLDQGMLPESIVELQSAVRQGPKNAAAHNALGRALQKANRLDEAAAQYQIALSLDDTLADAHNNLGFLLLKRRQFEEAKQHYARAIELEPTYADAQLNLAFLNLTLRDYNGAITHARRNLELKPASPVPGQLCIGLALRGLGRLDDAIRTLQDVVKQTPGDNLARQELARTIELKARASRN
jgi:protein O-mannosyl-transferase